MLYLVATPIGNLGDLTYRAVKTLSSCDYILCEDTRHAAGLLKAYEIKKPLRSYHGFNAARKEDEIVEDLRAGKDIALISDAGTPGISDPGQRLVQRCLAEELEYTALPGACSPIIALTLSGFESEPFQFAGFLPKKPSHLKQALNDALTYRGTTIFLESPHRVIKTLKLLEEMAPERKLGVARELTKIHEEVRIGTASELLNITSKGEIVLLIPPLPPVQKKKKQKYQKEIKTFFES